MAQRCVEYPTIWVNFAKRGPISREFQPIFGLRHPEWSRYGPAFSIRIPSEVVAMTQKPLFSGGSSFSWHSVLESSVAA